MKSPIFCKFFLIGFTLLTWQSVYAQYSPTIRSIRPGASVGTYTIGKNVFQVQTGLLFGNKEGLGLDQNTIFFKNVFRYGITERIELSAVLNWRKNMPDDPVIDAIEVKGISNLRIGGRINLVNKKTGFFRAMGINGRIWIKPPEENFQAENLGSRIVVAAGFAFPQKWKMVLNTGLIWQGNNDKPTSLYALRFLYGLNKSFGFILESYGTTDRWEPDFGAGVYYFIENDVKLDLQVGFLGEKEIDNRFIELGVSWRLKFRHP